MDWIRQVLWSQIMIKRRCYTTWSSDRHSIIGLDCAQSTGCDSSSLLPLKITTGRLHGCFPCASSVLSNLTFTTSRRSWLSRSEHTLRYEYSWITCFLYARLSHTCMSMYITKLQISQSHLYYQEKGRKQAGLISPLTTSLCWRLTPSVVFHRCTLGAWLIDCSEG